MLSRSMALCVIVRLTHLPGHPDLPSQELLLAPPIMLRLRCAIARPLFEPPQAVPPLLFYGGLPLLYGGKSVLPSLLAQDLPPEQLCLPVRLWCCRGLEQLRRWLELYVHGWLAGTPAVVDWGWRVEE